MPAATQGGNSFALSMECKRFTDTLDAAFTKVS
jgi:hypothetical protein